MPAGQRSTADDEADLGVPVDVEAANPPGGPEQMLEDRPRFANRARRHAGKIRHRHDAHAISRPDSPAPGLARGVRPARSRAHGYSAAMRSVAPRPRDLTPSSIFARSPTTIHTI